MYFCSTDDDDYYRPRRFERGVVVMAIDLAGSASHISQQQSAAFADASTLKFMPQQQQRQQP